MNEYRVLVCGGRDFKDRYLLSALLTEIHNHRPITLIIEGGAEGADRLAGEWAHKMQIPYLVVPAEWNKHGKRAGYLRNAEMLTYHPDLVVAFPGGNGTQMMIDLAKKATVEVTEIVAR